MRKFKPREIDRIMVYLNTAGVMMLFMYTMGNMDGANMYLYYGVAKIPHIVISVLGIYIMKYVFTLPNGISGNKKSPVLTFVKYIYNMVRK